MSKRKREEVAVEQDEDIRDQALRIRVSRLKAKVGQGNRRIAAALKLARGFERQKLGRRQKTAAQDPHTLLRLREEVIILKQLDLAKTAKDYLFKQLVKTRRIKESPTFVHVYGSDPKVNPVNGGAEANVLGRLFKSNPTREAVDETLDGIYAIVGLDSARGTIEIPVEDNDTTHEQDPSQTDNEDPFRGFSDIDEDSEAEAEGRVAGVSSEEVFIEDEVRMVSSSDTDSYGVSEDLEKNGPRVRDIAKTAFLPSLSMGGYYSGSESDDVSTADFPAAGLEPPRKNRRGQRARQQINELKYGKNAKHLQYKDTTARDAGWDAKKGAIDRNSHWQDRNGKSSSAPRPRSANSDRGPTDKGRKPRNASARRNVKDDAGPLHPSWEAAKQRKMQNNQTTAFAGKKITFD